MDGHALAKSVAERPEQFGELRGRTGLLGENKERKAARQLRRAVGNHVAAAAKTAGSGAGCRDIATRKERRR